MNSAIASRLSFRFFLLKELNITRTRFFFFFHPSMFGLCFLCFGPILRHLSFCAREMEQGLILICPLSPQLGTCTPRHAKCDPSHMWAESEEDMITPREIKV